MIIENIVFARHDFVIGHLWFGPHYEFGVKCEGGWGHTEDPYNVVNLTQDCSKDFV